MHADATPQTVTDTAANPLLETTAPPRFTGITPEHVVPGIRTLLTELNAQLELAEEAAAPSWATTVEPITRINERLSLAWGTVGHLMGVHNSDALRAAHQTVQPEVVAFYIRLGQSKPLYKALKALETAPEWATLDGGQQRIVHALVRDAELSGVGLEGEAQARFNVVQTELAELSTRFSNNVLDATKAWALTLRTPEEVEGLPPSARGLAAQAANQAGEDGATPEAGPWRITLDGPSYGPFMQHARRRDLREQVYRAFVTRASSGDHDNTPVMEQILRLRREHAGAARLHQLCRGEPGQQDGARTSPPSSACSRSCVRPRGTPPCATSTICARCAREAGAPEADDLRNWDVAFWAERLREQRYAYSDEAAPPLLPPAPRARRPVRARGAPLRRARARRGRRSPGVAPRRALLPRRRRGRHAARGLLSRPVQPPRREARRRMDGRVRRTARRARLADRLPGLQPGAAGRRQAVAA